MYLTLRDRPNGTRSASTANIRRRVSSTVFLLGVVSMFTDISTESVNAVLPKYLIVVVGLSPQAFGFVNGLYTGISSVIRILGGWLADRADHPKWVAFVGYFISALSRVGLLYSVTFSSIRAVVTGDRLGKGLRTAPRDAVIAASSPPEALGRAYGVHRSLDSLGAALGPLAAFWILSVVANGFHAVFVVSLAFAVIGVAILILIVPDVRPRRATQEAAVAPGSAPASDPVGPPASDVVAQPSGAITAPRPRVNLRQLANPQMARLVVVASVLSVLTVGDAFLYLQLQFRDNLANNYYALLMVGMNVAYLIVAVPLGRLADRIGRAKVFIGGHVALLLCYLCAAGPFAGPILSIGTLVMLGTYYAATDGTLAALSGRISDPGVRASGIATAQTFQAAAGFGSSLLVGLLWTDLGLRNAILWYCPFLLLAIPLGYWMIRSLDRRHSGRLSGVDRAVAPEPA